MIWIKKINVINNRLNPTDKMISEPEMLQYKVPEMKQKRKNWEKWNWTPQIGGKSREVKEKKSEKPTTESFPDVINTTTQPTRSILPK